MRNKVGLKALAITIVLVIVASSVAMYSATDVEKGLDNGWRNGIISLVPPSFISIVSARDDGGVAAAYRSAFPEDEAGLSAYVNTKQTIDLEKIKTTFTEVEKVGDNYIIGITPIPDFGGDINVTVYADTSGWIVAYFKKGEPAAMLMQWGKDTDLNNPVITEITTTTLKDAIYAAAIASDIPPATLPGIKYYDFEFPNANGMMLFIRTMATDGANIVQVEIPTTYTLYDASYYHYAYAGSTTASSKLKIDETIISNSFNISNNKWWRVFDSYWQYLTTGTLHTMEISYDVSGYDSGSAGVATVLIYNTDKTPICPYLRVSDITNDNTHVGKKVKVLGTVADASSGWGEEGLDFVLTDGEATITVTYTGSLSQSLKEGQVVGAIGVQDTPSHVTADQLDIKCASKYE